MYRFPPLLFIALALASPQVASAPSCSHGMKHIDACVSGCRIKLGWRGLSMGDDRGNRVVNACGGPKNQTSPEAALGTGSSPPATTLTPSHVLPTPIVGAGPPKLLSNSSTTVTSPTPHNFAVSRPSSLNLSGDVHKPTLSLAGTTKECYASSPSSPSPTHTPTTTRQQLSSSSSTTPSTPKPTSTTSHSSGTISLEDTSAYLSAHNNVRAQHGALALAWSDELSAKARQWADGCVFKHSGDSLGPFGENLAAGTGPGYTIASVVEYWADEASEYDPNNPVSSHFTQVVWKTTTQVGCAVQDCSGIFDPRLGLAHFHVCEYSPAGNVIGEFAQNVQVQT